MGAYKAAVVTEGGQNLIAQVLATNKALAFTSAKTSNYAYPSGTNITALTGLQDVVQSTQPFKAQAINDNVAQVSVRFDNDGITQQYQIQTIGLYAKIEDGEEILFSVIQAITPDEMPVQSSVSPSAFIYNIQSTVQNASQITITVNPAGTATVQDILDLENPVFDDSGAVAGITSFPNFLSTLVSKMNIFQFYRNLKAGLQFVLHTGQIVNNCMSESPDLPLAAAQGKVLMDLYTQLNSKFTKGTWNPLLSDLVSSSEYVTLKDLGPQPYYSIGNIRIYTVYAGESLLGGINVEHLCVIKGIPNNKTPVGYSGFLRYDNYAGSPSTSIQAISGGICFRNTDTKNPTGTFGDNIFSLIQACMIVEV